MFSILPAASTIRLVKYEPARLKLQVPGLLLCGTLLVLLRFPGFTQQTRDIGCHP